MWADRAAAGAALAARIVAAGAPEAPVVLATAPGGVALGREIALALGAPLDLALIAPLGRPGGPLLGAVAELGPQEVVFDGAACAGAGLGPADLAADVAAARATLGAARARWAGAAAPARVAGRTAIVVDDGACPLPLLEHGLAALRRRGTLEMWLALPAAPQATLWHLRGRADRLVHLEAPRAFDGIEHFFEDFTPPTDPEIIAALAAAHAGEAS